MPGDACGVPVTSGDAVAAVAFGVGNVGVGVSLFCVLIASVLDSLHGFLCLCLWILRLCPSNRRPMPPGVSDLNGAGWPAGVFGVCGPSCSEWGVDGDSTGEPVSMWPAKRRAAVEAAGLRLRLAGVLAWSLAVGASTGGATGSGCLGIEETLWKLRW